VLPSLSKEGGLPYILTLVPSPTSTAPLICRPAQGEGVPPPAEVGEGLKKVAPRLLW